MLTYLAFIIRKILKQFQTCQQVSRYSAEVALMRLPGSVSLVHRGYVNHDISPRRKSPKNVTELGEHLFFVLHFFCSVDFARESSIKNG